VGEVVPQGALAVLAASKRHSITRSVYIDRVRIGVSGVYSMAHRMVSEECMELRLGCELTVLEPPHACILL
jgi:hypothetical protein